MRVIRNVFFRKKTHESVTFSSSATRGVVLLEAVVAIGILGMLVSAVLSLTARSSFAMYSAADRLTAAYLAHDAAEAIRARKMYNENLVLDWLREIGESIPCDSSTGPCDLNTRAPSYNNLDLVRCNDRNCVLDQESAQFKPSDGVGGDESYFRREITLKTNDLDSGIPGVEEATYTITVYWRTGRGYEESVTTNMTLYRNNP